MRVVLLSAEYPPTPGGVGDYTQCLGAALHTRVDALDVWTIRAGMLCAINPLMSDQIGTPIAPASWDWQCWGAIRAGLRRIQPDILHIQYQTGAYQMHPAIHLLPARLQLDSQRPQLVVTAHDLLMPYLLPKARPLRSWVTRRLLEDCDAAIVTNPEDLAAITGQEPERRQSDIRFVGHIRRKPYVIPIGSNITPNPPPGYRRAQWRATLGITPETTLIAYFGLISPTKGLDVLLDALEQLPSTIRLLIIGGDSAATQDRPYATQLRQRLQSPPLAGRVLVTGHCPPPEVSAHLLAADLAVLPFTDGATFRRGSLLATLAHGLPVITTSTAIREQATSALTYPSDLPVAQSIAPPASAPSTQLPKSGISRLPMLIDQHNVALVAIGDSHALATTIQMLANNPAQRNRLAEGARSLSAAFGWEAIAEQHIMLYQQLVATKR